MQGIGLDTRGARAGYAALLVVSACLVWVSPGHAWTKPKQLNKDGVKVLRVDGGAGKKGYGVIAWSQVADRAPLVQRNVFGFVRVKAPGEGRFGKAVSLGRVNIGPTVSVGENGHTLLTWSRLDGSQMVITRGPESGWSRPQRIRGKSLGGAGGEVGPDGTMVLLSSGARSVSDRTARVLVSMKGARSKRFGAWKKISKSGLTVGFDADLVVGRAGRATVVWSGPCPLGSGAKNAMWVDLKGSHASKPRQILNSKCVAYDLQLEQDRAGYQYLRIGGSEKIWIGVKLGVRRPGEPFPTIQFVSPDGQLTDGGKMTVSPKGNVFLTWTGYDENEHPLSRDFATFRRDKKLAGPAAIAGARVDTSGRFDRLQAMGFLPNGMLSTVWWEQWRVTSGPMTRFRLGPKQIDPLRPSINHEYTIGVKPNLVPSFVTMATATDGSRLAWWNVERLDYARKILWIEARRPHH